jgi:hypothetical protein
MKKLLLKLKKQVQKKSRAAKQDYFYSLCKPHDKILDVGVHQEKPNSPESANYFLKTLRYDPANYTGLGIEDMGNVRQKYPHLRFIQYPGGRFPFKDKEFDWIYSNAVIEHVGDIPSKIEFIREMCRTSKNVFFTTPNKYFPLDSHTMVWFTHWNDDRFLRWREKNKQWLPKEKLNLISFKELSFLLREAGVSNYQIKRNRLLGITMTFTIVIGEVPGDQPQQTTEQVDHLPPLVSS